jgi:hypothetical protein
MIDSESKAPSRRRTLLWATVSLLAILSLVIWMLVSNQQVVRVRPHPEFDAFSLKVSSVFPSFRAALGSDENGDGIPEILMTRRDKVGFSLKRSIRSMKLRPKYQADFAHWIASDSGDFIRSQTATQSQSFDVRFNEIGFGEIVRTEADHVPVVVGEVESVWKADHQELEWQGKSYLLSRGGLHMGNRIELREVDSEVIVFERKLERFESVVRSAGLRKQGRFLTIGASEESSDIVFREFRLATMTETSHRVEAASLGLSERGEESLRFLALQSKPNQPLAALLLIERTSGAQLVAIDFATQPARLRPFWDVPGLRRIVLSRNVAAEQIDGQAWVAIATIEPGVKLASTETPKLKLRVRPPSGQAHLTTIPLASIARDPIEDWRVYDLHSKVVPDQDGDGVPDFILLVECTCYRDLAVWFLCSGASGRLIPGKGQRERARIAQNDG